ENNKGTSMGMPFNGTNMFAYDNILKKYQTNWVDNFGTGMMRGEGERKGNVITIHATYPSLTPGEDYKYRMVYDVKSKDMHVFHMFMIAEDGKEVKTMEITYTRKK
ncbi:MAG: DUF1579 family protein, partial [Bacteroidota bacterium]